MAGNVLNLSIIDGENFEICISEMARNALAQFFLEKICNSEIPIFKQFFPIFREVFLKNSGSALISDSEFRRYLPTISDFRR